MFHLLRFRLRQIVLACCAFLGIQACQGQQTFEEMTKSLYKNTVPLVYPARAQTWEKALFLDAREPSEFAVSHLPKAKFLGYEAPDWSAVEGLPKDALIVVYCSVGYRSERIGEALHKRGFTRVYNLYGGIFDWVNQDLPVVNAQGQTQAVHPYNESWGKWLQKGEKRYE